MSAVQVVAQLSQRLSPADTARVLAALKQDELVWQGISQPGLVEKVAATAEDGLGRWSPVNFALAALETNLSAVDLRVVTGVNLSAALLQSALAALDTLNTPDPVPAGLPNAVRVALALQDRYNLSHNWDHVFTQSGLTAGSVSSPAASLWRAAVLCLYPLLVDPAAMLAALIHRVPAAVAWSVNALLANPTAQEQHQERHLAVLKQISLEDQLEWLKCLQSHHQPELVRFLAQSLLSSDLPAFTGLLEPLALSDAALPQLGQRLARLQQAAVLHMLAGSPDQSVALLSTARDIAAQTLVHSLARQSAAAGQSFDLDCPTEWLSPALSAEKFQADLSLIPFGPRWDALLLDLPADQPLHPLLTLRQANLLAGRGDLLRAQEIARKAAPRLAAAVQSGQLAASPFPWNPVETLLSLVRLGLADEAAQLAGAALSARPADVDLLTASSRIFEQNGDLDQSIEYAFLCTSLTPGDAALTRRLAILYETAGKWTEALQQRENWLALLPQPGPDDLLETASTAVRAAQLPRARQLCEQVLSADPDNGSAHGLMGQVCLNQGQPKEAVAHLSQATLLCPDQPQPWLQLARVLHDQGQPQQSLETLRAAVMAAPGSADLYYALASACLRDGLPTEALTALREAGRLNPDSPDIAALYADVLHDLGHTAEARALLQQARRRWPAHSQLAAVDGRTLLDAGRLDDALPAFEIALQSPLPEPVWFLWYARALLHDNRQGIPAGVDDTRLEKAYNALQTAAQLLGDNFEANVLMAEVLRARQSADQAYALYQSLVDRPEAAGSDWRWRVQTGFGQVALALNQVETAVAALREAAQARPADLAIQHLLAEAYMKADLKPESAQTARQALQLDAESIDNLSWFIDHMTRLGLELETIPALTAAAHLAPRQPVYWNRLARLQQQSGDIDAARASLNSLLALEHLTAGDLHAAAETCIALNDLNGALACLERALALSPVLSADLLFEIASLHQQLGQPEAALETVEKAIEAAPEELALHILQADLLVWLGRREAARACLEAALFLQQKQSADADRQPALACAICAPGGWLETASAPAAIHTRLAALLSLAGDLAGVLRTAEKGLDLQPGSRALRALAVQAARGLLDSSRAADLLQIEDLSASEDRWSQALTAHQVEMALEAGEIPQAARLIEANIASIPDEPHLLAIQARLLSRMGDLPGAVDALFAASACLDQPTGAPGSLGSENILWRAYQNTAPLAIAEAALDLERWEQARAAFSSYVETHPNELRAHLRYARALVLSAERQRLACVLHSVSHAPGEIALAEDTELDCEHALDQAGRAGFSAEVNTWRARVRAVFQPNLQNAPALAKLPPSAENAAALMSVLRLSKNAGNAVRLVHHYPESPELLLQVALCYRELDPAQGLAAAGKAVEHGPHQPLNHAGLASLAQACGDLSAAEEALENAIAIWPDEPEWHVWAADLCQQTGQDTLALAHWEKALALCPDRIDYALTLSGLHLDHGNGIRAIEILTQAARVNPEDKSVWMKLAHAYLFSGRPETALDCSARAVELDPADHAPLLLSGEIALQLGRPDLALTHARAAQAVSANQPDVILFHARTLVQKGQLTEALSVLEKSLPALSGSQPILLERANLVRRLHGAAVALPLLIELAQLFPQDAAILTILAQTEADCGDLRSAGRTAYAAYHLNPDLPQINLLLGRLQHQTGQLDQAIHFLSEAVRLSYGDLDAYLDLAQAYQERREDDQALHTLQQAIQAAPRDFRPYYRAALVLRENKDYITAEAMLRRAAELAPDDLNIRRQLGAVVALNLVHNSQEVNSIL